MKKCKHEIIYRRYDPVPGSDLWDALFGEIKLQKVEKTYDQLTRKERESVDKYNSRKSSWKRCSEHCGNTVSPK